MARKRKENSETQSVQEVEERLGVDGRTVRRLWVEGKLRGFSTGHGIRITKASVDALLNGTGGDAGRAA